MVAATGQISGPIAPQAGIPVPLAELFAVASAHERAGRLADAARVLSHILAADPDQPDALHLAGVLAFRSGRRMESLSLLRRSLEMGEDTPLHWRNICEVLRVLGHLDESLAAGRRAVALNPHDPVNFANLAMTHAERLELDEAEACEVQAIALDPGFAGAHFGLSEIKLLRGDFAAGWEEYEWRFRLPGANVYLPPGGGVQWDGHPLPPGRLLVIADQGFGDVIQFGRMMDWVLERCPAPLAISSHEMAEIIPQLGQVLPFPTWESLPAYDAYIPLSGLPRLVGVDLDNIPGGVPYLHAEPALVAQWAPVLDRLSPGRNLRVGLAWAGRPAHGNDHRRSATLAQLGPLLAADYVTFISLQKGERQGELARHHGEAPVVNLGPELADWADTMAVLSLLDAVVTVDTAVAHFAGAMGRPVHVMLPYAGDWRWLLGRTDCPWYPTMRLHRQASQGNWLSAAQSAAGALAELAPRR